MQDVAVGGSIAAQVRDLEVPTGHLAVWALGQHGYLLKGDSHVVVIDPYLSNYVEELSGDAAGAFARLVPIVVPPGDLDMITLALCTHAHADHCDPYTIKPLIEASPYASLLTSYKGKEALEEAGVDPARIEVPPIERAVLYGEGFEVTAIPSAHYGFEPDTEGNPAYLGFIVELNGVRLYHSGDTVIYDGLVEQLRPRQIDIMFLPINGGDWFRNKSGLVGNMDYREAAELAATAGAKVLIPSHNDMFAGNRVNPAYLLDYLTTHHPGKRVHFLQAGELYYYVSA